MSILQDPVKCHILDKAIPKQVTCPAASPHLSFTFLRVHAILLILIFFIYFFFFWRGQDFTYLGVTLKVVYGQR